MVEMQESAAPLGVVLGVALTVGEGVGVSAYTVPLLKASNKNTIRIDRKMVFD